MFNLEPLTDQIKIFNQYQLRTHQLLEQILTEIKNQQN